MLLNALQSIINQPHPYHLPKMGNSQSSRADIMTKAPAKEHIHRSSQIARGRKSIESDETFTTQDLQSTEVQFVESSDGSDVDTDSDHESVDSEEEQDEGTFSLLH